jgi:ribosome maturation factor RimP
VDTRSEALEELVRATLADIGLELVDIEHLARRLRVTVDAEGGVDLDVLSAANGALSRALDAHDDLTPAGPYELEVSSPGLERPLRLPAHFVRARGREVALRLRAGAEEPRRLEGVLLDADDEAVLVAPTPAAEGRRIRYEAIERAHTVFRWGATDRAEGRGPRRKTPSQKTPSRETRDRGGRVSHE